MEKRAELVKQAKGLGTVIAALLFVASIPLWNHVMGAMRQAIQPRSQVAPITGTSWSVVTSKDGVLLVTTMRAFRNARRVVVAQAD